MIPEISISPAPPMETMAEPYSPFSSIKFPDNGDDFRPRLLTPPPSSPLRSRHSSSPSSGGYNSDEERFDYNEGLDKQRFEALLQATRERNTGRAQDLRREVTLKAHNAKQSTWISDVHTWLFTNSAHSRATRSLYNQSLDWPSNHLPCSARRPAFISGCSRVFQTVKYDSQRRPSAQ